MNIDETPVKAPLASRRNRAHSSAKSAVATEGMESPSDEFMWRWRTRNIAVEERNTEANIGG